ncbi:MAG: ABC transporter substrate-binding protein [Actinomycetota bacterium]
MRSQVMISTTGWRATMVVIAIVAASCGGGTDSDSADDGGSAATAAPTTSDVADVDDAAETESTPEASIVDDDAVDVDAVDDAVESAFPVTIDHRFGSTTIDEEPLRIVSLGNGTEDVLISLDVMPIALGQTFEGQDFIVWPWAQDEYDALLAQTGADEPEVLPIGAGQWPFERIAELDPDLILAANTAIEVGDYELLSQIAPTVARPEQYRHFGIPLREWVELVATAVGRGDRAEQVIDDLDAQFAAAAADNPQFADTTATIAFYSPQSGNVVTYPPADFRHQFVRDLGFEVNPELDALAGDERFVLLSPELIETIDADVVIWVPGSAIDIQATRDLPVRQALLTAAQRRSEVIADTLVSNALTNYSPLAVEFALEQLVNDLALAADGDPETVAASAGVLYQDGDFVATPEQQAAIEALLIVFDSQVPIEDKRPFVEDFDELRGTFDEYQVLADGLGGITAEVVSATSEGETVAIVYNAVAGGNVALGGLVARLAQVDGVWTVSRAELCGAIAAAGIECPA